MVVWLAGIDIYLQRANTAITASRHIHTNNEKPFGVKKGAFSYQSRPPFGRIAVGGKRMKYPYHIAFVFIQCTQGSIRQMQLRYSFPALQLKGLIVCK